MFGFSSADRAFIHGVRRIMRNDGIGLEPALVEFRKIAHFFGDSPAMKAKIEKEFKEAAEGLRAMVADARKVRSGESDHLLGLLPGDVAEGILRTAIELVKLADQSTEVPADERVEHTVEPERCGYCGLISWVTKN